MVTSAAAVVASSEKLLSRKMSDNNNYLHIPVQSLRFGLDFYFFTEINLFRHNIVQAINLLKSFQTAVMQDFRQTIHQGILVIPLKAFLLPTKNKKKEYLL